MEGDALVVGDDGGVRVMIVAAVAEEDITHREAADSAEALARIKEQ